jgi:hypothetical protein
MPEITAFVWQEEEKGRFGEGISRPRPKASVRPYTLIIYQPGARPMTWSTKAESKKCALQYARNRWPMAAVEVA